VTTGKGADPQRPQGGHHETTSRDARTDLSRLDYCDLCGEPLAQVRRSAACVAPVGRSHSPQRAPPRATAEARTGRTGGDEWREDGSLGTIRRNQCIPVFSGVRPRRLKERAWTSFSSPPVESASYPLWPLWPARSSPFAANTHRSPRQCPTHSTFPISAPVAVRVAIRGLLIPRDCLRAPLPPSPRRMPAPISLDVNRNAKF